MGLDKHLKEVLPTGGKVYYVNENFVQTHFRRPTPGAGGKDFTLGGNHNAYPTFIPKGEYWISDPRSKRVRDEYKRMRTTPTGVMIHEIKEADDMRYKHMPYRKDGNGAHRAATRLERRYLDGDVSKRHAVNAATRNQSRSRSSRRR